MPIIYQRTNDNKPEEGDDGAVKAAIVGVTVMVVVVLSLLLAWKIYSVHRKKNFEQEEGRRMHEMKLQRLQLDQAIAAANVTIMRPEPVLSPVMLPATPRPTRRPTPYPESVYEEEEPESFHTCGRHHHH